MSVFPRIRRTSDDPPPSSLADATPAYADDWRTPFARNADGSWRHVGVTTDGGEVSIAITGTPAPTVTLEFDATPELARILSGGALTSISLAPLPDLADWLHTQIDTDIAEVTATCRTAGVTLAAAANAWPDVRRQLAWADAMRDLVDLHTANYDGRCYRCVDASDPWAANVPWPCLTLRYLAVAYTDRPGYLEQWAIDG